MIETNETLRANINVSSSISGVVKNGVEYIKPLTQEKSVMPNIEEQVVVPDEGFSGLSKVIIEPVSLQTKESTPIEEEQIIIADDEFLGLKEVKIKSIPSEYKKPTGTKEISSNGEYNVASYEKALVNVEKTLNLQTKTITPTKSTMTAITDYGYDGLEKVIVNPIPSEYIIPSGSMIITKNGEYDVTNLSSVVADVQESGEEKQYFATLSSAGSSNGSALYKSVIDIPSGTKITNGKYQFYGCTSLIKVPLLDYSTLTDCTCMFRGCNAITDTTGAKNFNKITNAGSMFYATKIQSIDMSSWNVANLTKASFMFNECSNLVSVNISNWNSTQNIDFERMFYYCSKLTTLTGENANLSGTLYCSNMFYKCTKLTELNLSWMYGEISNASKMFYQCINLRKLDIRNLDISTCSSFSDMLGDVPAPYLEIIVKDDACKNWFNTKFPTYTNVKTVAELGE